MALSINEQTWEGLPEEVQTALNESAEIYRAGLAQYSMNEAERALQTMAANGATIVEVSQEERTEWANGMDNIAKEWATEVDATGAPGDEILSAYIEAMRAASQPVLRDWSAQ
jgi:TRAP-type C4-dicarboxylate transport system substrate-binding protein